MNIFNIFKKEKKPATSIENLSYKGMVINTISNVSPQIITPPTVPVKLSTVDLIKKVETEAPHLVDLTKKCFISLEKNNLGDVVAIVILVLDASGSMRWQYSTEGRQISDVQKVINRIVPLALKFDNNQSLDVLAFADKTAILNPITLKNVNNYTINEWNGWQHWMSKLNSAINNEPVTMRYIIDNYRDSKLPVYVAFISDGGIDKDAEIKKLLIESSKLPIFWQFIGVGGSNYGILEQFDTLKGRYIDNANFFSVDRIDSISNETLYNLLGQEFPLWIKLAKSKAILKI